MLFRSTVGLLARFGEHLGLAFQLVDDLLGIWGSPDVTGKPALADLRSRKKSVPVVAALNSGTEAAGRLAELYFQPHQPDQVDDEAALIAMADLIERAGARAWTEAEADRHIAQADECLAALAAPSDVTEALRATALFVTRRDR